MSEAKPLAEVQRAKAGLQESLKGRDWCKGIGIAPAKEKDRFALRLTVDPAAKGDPEIPREYDGVPVEVVYMAAYKPRARRAT